MIWLHAPTFAWSFFSHYTGVEEVVWFFMETKDWPVICGLASLYPAVSTTMFTFLYYAHRIRSRLTPQHTFSEFIFL